MRYHKQLRHFLRKAQCIIEADAAKPYALSYGFHLVVSNGYSGTFATVYTRENVIYGKTRDISHFTDFTPDTVKRLIAQECPKLAYDNEANAWITPQ